MKISDEEKKYIARIYQHGVSHLIDDAIPNRILCIHNLHWCIENLLRIATKDWDIDYKAGFNKIFKKFISRHSVPKDLEKSIFNLNEMRNGVEHREYYPDMTVLRKIVPDIENFIKWIINVIFNSSIDLLSISSADEDKIFDDFSRWKDQKLGSNIKLTFEREKRIYDYIFICIIPASCSSNLVDLSFDGENEMLSAKTTHGVTMSVLNPEHQSKIEKYFRVYQSLFGNAQVYTVPTHLEYVEAFYGSEIKVFPDGRVYICYQYWQLNPEKPTFNMEFLYNKSRGWIVKKQSKLYGSAITKYFEGNLECLLKVVCFLFHPECKEKLVNNPIKYFRGFFILPMMNYEGKDRILDRSDNFNHIFEVNREYGGDESDIIFQKTFIYDEITSVVNEFKNWAYGFFRNKRDTSFSY